MIVKIWLKLQIIHDIQIFLNLANFYKQFIKDFSKIATLFTLMLKTTISSTSGLLGHTKRNINKLDKDSDGGINGGKIDDRIVNLLTTIKKISFEKGFFTFEDNLAFI